jgi:acetoin utilization protein AcuB
MTNLGKIKDWMTPEVITVEDTTSVIDADRKMREFGIRRLVVVNGKGKLVGIVTKGDIREASPSDATALSIWEVNYLVAKLKVKDAMTTNVETVSPEANIIDAAEVMLNKKISGLPVIDENGSIVGMITESDIFRMLVRSRVELSGTVSE